MQRVITKTPPSAAPFVFETKDNGFENEAIKMRLWTRDEYYKMAQLGFVYTEIEILTEKDLIAPLAAPDAKIQSRRYFAVVAKVLREIYTFNDNLTARICF